MLAWMLYVTFITLLLSGAALAAERAARLRRARTRWIWVLAILASLAIPMLIASVSIQIPSLLIPTVTRNMTALRETTAVDVFPLTWVRDHADRSATLRGLSSMLPRYWVILSVALAAACVLNAARLSWRTRRWRMGTVAGARAFIAPNGSPAVVGFLHPRIVLPAWLSETPASYQALVVAHQQAHLARHDPQVLGVALFLQVLMPWNLPLWWQLHRLRGAMEADCDARVLEKGLDPEAYRQMLLDLSQRPSAYVGVRACLSEPGSQLKPRIGILGDRGKRGSVPAIVLGCLAVALVAVAARVTPPNVSRQADEEPPALTLAPEILERYVGLYVMSGHAVIVISREGSHLFIKPGNGVFPRTELTAETETDFWIGLVGPGGHDRFVLDEQGRVTGILEYSDRPKVATFHPRVEPSIAQQILASNQVRFQSQKPVAGSEAALRRMIDGVLNGKCIDEEAPWLRRVCEQTMAELHWNRIYASRGAVQSVIFTRVDEVGQDVYDVRQEGGRSEWAIYLDENGVIQDAQNQ
jgi:hypothetical protein